MDAKQLRETADKLFMERGSYISLLQEIADNFYPQRADFTVNRSLGDKYAEDLMTSYPVITRRELGDQIGVMLRPTDKEWFKMVPKDRDRMDIDAKRWLDWATKRMKAAMYDRRSKFSRAVKESDHDFATFGQAVMNCRLNRQFDSLLYRNWHIRDVVWKENEDGEVGFVARKWRLDYRDAVRMFGDKVHANIKRDAGKKPFEKIKVYHIVCEADMYNDDSRGRGWFSVVYDCNHNTVMEAVPVWMNEYVIPRWQTVSGSQYAFSPATITALPDARLIQSMAYALLEAGEKAVNPPMVATEDAVRSDVSIFAGGITWVDIEYDERLGDALRPLNQDLRGLPFGQDMIQDSRGIIHQAFFLNKLTLPERAPEMTAYEVGQRVQEYIRGALPIFEPMEIEYNGGICEQTFEVMMRAGGFGSPHDIPKSLQGADIEFQFESPLHDAIEQQKGQKFLEAKEMLMHAMEIDQTAVYSIDFKTAMRDAMQGVGIPAKWMTSETEANQAIEEQKEAEAQQMQMAQLAQGAETAQAVGEAAKSMTPEVAA